MGVVCGVGPLGEAWTDEGTNAQNVQVVGIARHSPVAEQIPGSTLTMLEGEGHMSLAIHHAQPFGEALVA